MLMKKQYIIILLVLFAAALFGFAANQVIMLRKAHSTFESYYAFRGCVQLLEKTESYGVCKTDSGQTIKIVKYQNRWYLDGDLTACNLSICF